MPERNENTEKNLTFLYKRYNGVGFGTAKKDLTDIRECRNMKKRVVLERRSKGQFCKNTVYLEWGMPYSCFCGHKCSASYALMKDYNPISVYLQINGLHKPKAPLCKGSWRQRRLRDCFNVTITFYNPSVTASRATSPYTGEAFVYIPEGKFIIFTKYVYKSQKLWYNNLATQNLINKLCEGTLYFYRGFYPYAYMLIMNLAKTQIPLSV